MAEASTFTTRLNLEKPDPSQEVDIDVINANMDKIDAAQAPIAVGTDVVPSNSALYNGALVIETPNGKYWFAKTSGGGFTKASPANSNLVTDDIGRVAYRAERFILLDRADGASVPTAGGAWQLFSNGSLAWSSGGIGTGSGGFICPQNGIWRIEASLALLATAGGNLGMGIGINGTPNNGYIEQDEAIVGRYRHFNVSVLTKIPSSQVVAVYAINGTGASCTAAGYRLSASLISNQFPA
jgi:hypothetical protein